MKIAAAVLLLALFPAIGCGGSSNPTPACFITGINVFPQTAVVDHSATAPGNSQQFLAFQSSAPPGCAFAAAALQNAVWTVSDPVNASISNAHDQSNTNYGRATCINAAASPITVTATVPSGNGGDVSATAILTCK
jgi:hypothetical protein